MPLLVDGEGGVVGTATRLRRGDDPKVIIVVAIGDRAMSVALNPYEALLLGEAVQKDAETAMKFAPADFQARGDQGV